MIYDIRADHTSDAYANAMRAYIVRVNGHMVMNCIYADTEAGYAIGLKSSPAGPILLDAEGQPIEQRFEGVVVVEDRRP